MKINGQKWEDFEASDKYPENVKAACRVLKKHVERRQMALKERRLAVAASKIKNPIINIHHVQEN